MKLATKLKVEKEKQLEQHQRELKQKLNALVKCACNRVLTAIEMDPDMVLGNAKLIDSIFEIDDDATSIINVNVGGQFRNALFTYKSLRADADSVTDIDNEVSIDDTQSD